MPSDGWYGPAIDNHAPSDGGSHLGPVTVGVLHTTESTRFVPNSKNYFGHQSYPHFTVAVVTINGKRVFRSWQHISIRRAARALKNLSGGVQTNREGVIQIEVVGSAKSPFTDDPVMVEGLAKLMRWIESQTEIPARSSVTWTAYPASYGQRAKQRLSFAAWRAYAGWLGHEHVPENDHGDPGAIRIALLLGAAPAPASTTPTATVLEDTKMYAIYTDMGLDWGTDLITRRPFEDDETSTGQQKKAAWIATRERVTGRKVIRVELSPDEIAGLVPVGVEGL
jgi:hypothetical protein